MCKKDKFYLRLIIFLRKELFSYKIFIKKG